MEGDYDPYEADATVGELWTQLESIRGGQKGRRPISRTPLTRGLKIGIAVTAIVVAMGVAAAAVLFSHSFSYTAPIAKVSSTCAQPTSTSGATTIVFSCPSGAALTVASGATGSVTYSAFSPTPPVAILDIYLIDTAATLAATCGQTTSNGNEPVALAPGGGSLTISSSAGNLRPNHSYDYCMDTAVLPPSFTTGVTWSQ